MAHVHNASRNPLRADPTRTTLIRRRFQADMRRRMRELKRHVWEFMVTLDALGLKDRFSSGPASGARLRGILGGTIANNEGPDELPIVLAAPQPREFEFRTDAGKVKGFRDWLKEQIRSDVLSVKGGQQGKPWTATYIESAYKKGVVNAYAAARSQLDLFEGAEGKAQAAGQFIREAFGQPERLSKVELLATRSFEELEGITSQMGQQLNRVLADGMVNGSGVKSIAREMTDKIDGITNRRALTLARTEVIHAHAEGQLDAFEELGVEELGVQSEWSTAGDDRVCPECEKMEGKVFSTEEAHGMIPLHPNCRCTWIPHIPKHLLTPGGAQAPGLKTGPKKPAAAPAPEPTRAPEPVQEDVPEQPPASARELDPEDQEGLPELPAPVPAEAYQDVFESDQLDLTQRKQLEKAVETSEAIQARTVAGKTFSRAEKDALFSYQDQGFETTNRFLRTSPDLDTPGTFEGIRKDQIASEVRLLDSAISKGSLPEDLVLFRGLSTSVPLNPGTVMVDKAFVSTSLSSKEAFKFGKGKQLIAIRAPKGAKGISIDAVTLFLFTAGLPSEHEVVLPRGSKFLITGERIFKRLADGTLVEFVVVDLIV